MTHQSTKAADFIDRCATHDPARCAEDFLSTVKEMGFEGGACGAWAGVGKNRRNRFFFVDWPPDWVEFYEANRFHEVDFMLVEARRRISPFWGGQVIKGIKLTAKQRQFVDAASRRGWTDVLGIPIHGPGSLQGLVTLITRGVPTLSAVDAAMLEIMSRVVFERCRQAEDFGLFAPSKLDFTAREIECLQWAAAGKSDKQIAGVLGLKPATVHFHIEQAKRRSNVKSRVEAVAVGVLGGFI